MPDETSDRSQAAPSGIAVTCGNDFALRPGLPPASSGPLRRPGDEGFTPPYGHARFVAHSLVVVCHTPLRRDAERRQALVEIDALAAVMLGITAQELCAIYRTQFGVLRKYERVMQFDANGRQVPKEVLKDFERLGAHADLGRYELPFAPIDREAEMTIAHAEFTRRAAARA